MKKQNSKILVFVAIFLILILAVMIYFYQKSTDEDIANSNENNITEVIAESRNIIKMVSSSGEISSALEEKINLKDYRYLKEVYVEANEIVKKGENLLKYSNGTYLVAPYDLVIKSLNIGKIGEMSNSSQYLEVIDINNLIMTIDISENEKNSITEGQEVKIKLNAFEQKEIIGEVEKIDEIGKYNASGSTFKVRIKFKNDGNISIGMSAYCEIIIQKAENVVSVPVESVISVGDEKFVTVRNDDGTTKQVKIEIGISDDKYVQIKSGLQLGDKIQYYRESNQNNNGLSAAMNPIM